MVILRRSLSHDNRAVSEHPDIHLLEFNRMIREVAGLEGIDKLLLVPYRRVAVNVFQVVSQYPV
jgi:hypothetical protein